MVWPLLAHYHLCQDECQVKVQALLPHRRDPSSGARAGSRTRINGFGGLSFLPRYSDLGLSRCAASRITKQQNSFVSVNEGVNEHCINLVCCPRQSPFHFEIRTSAASCQNAQRNRFPYDLRPLAGTISTPLDSSVDIQPQLDDHCRPDESTSQTILCVVRVRRPTGSRIFRRLSASCHPSKARLLRRRRA